MKDDVVDAKLLHRERPVRTIGIAIILVVLMAFFVWAAVAPISSAVLANGEVRVDLSRVTLQHLEGGILKDVFVRDGDLVKEGDPLIALDDTSLRSEHDIVRKQLQGLRAMEARLLAESAGSSELSAQADSALNDSELALLYEKERALMLARKESFEREMSLLQERVRQAESQIAGLANVVQSKKEIRRSLQGEVDDLNRLVEQEFISRHRLNQMQRQLAGVESEISENQGTSANAAVQKSEAQRTMQFRAAERRSGILSDLSEVQKRIAELDSRFVSISARLARTTLRATSAGQVLGMRYPVPGAVLPPGATVADIVPIGADLLIEARIAPSDVEAVKLNGVTDIRLTAHNGAILPVIQGTVVYVAGDRLMDEKTGAPYFPVRVRVSPEGINELVAAKVKLLPGLPVQVVIKSGERTLLQYLIRPVSNLFASAFKEN